jgi:hypothetical protein
MDPVKTTADEKVEEEEEDREEEIIEDVIEIAPVIDDNNSVEETSHMNINENEIEKVEQEEQKEEIEEENVEQEAAKEEIIKTEFTYTSLTSFDDATVAAVSTTNGVTASKSNENGFNHSQSMDIIDKPMDNQQQSDLDKILEKLKTNQITNKEVVNYILNLLVGGEFDLEKNFIIKNVNNILYMMQVIKCANSSLKAEIWSLFTAILRKSQRNLQACVDVGLVEAALHELKDADLICAGKFSSFFLSLSLSLSLH